MSQHHQDNFTPPPGIDSRTCSAKAVGWSKLVACESKVYACHWRYLFADAAFCTHAENMQIASGKLASGWSLKRVRTLPAKSLGKVPDPSSGK